MPTDVIMPQMGESIFEGTISKWLKHIGDKVEKDEPLFEISTDKVDAEIPSPAAGVLSEIKADEGATVQVNTVVAVIGDGTGAAAAAQQPAKAAPAPQPVPAKAEAPPSAPPPAAEKPAPAAREAAAPQQQPQQPAEAPAGGAGKHVRTSPLVRRMAKENHLNLEEIPGSGLEGRITKEDVLQHMAQQGGAAPAQAQPQHAPEPSAPQPPARQAPAPAPAAEVPAPSGELVPLSKMRSIIAQRMVESSQTVPHVHTVFRVDMTRIVRLRERERNGYEGRNGVKLTYMPFIALAAIEALGKFPIVNAAFESGAIRYRRNVNLGIAVALEWGLIVPVVKQAEERNFLGLARAIADLADRARGKRLKPEEVGGSTFTLTNAGIFGEEFGMPIINQPDSAILGIGGLRKEPVVVTDERGEDSISIRSVQHFCLGFDHRLIDGADAGKFMSEFKKTLENWNQEIA